MSSRRRTLRRRAVAQGVRAEPPPLAPPFSADVRLFAWVAEQAGARSVRVELPDGARATTVVTRTLRAAGLEQMLGAGDALRLAVNREYVGLDHVVRPGDELALIPPVSGGAPAHVRIGVQPLDAIALQELVVTRGARAIVSFTGWTGDVERCFFEAYAEMAQRSIERIADAVAGGFRLEAIAIEHRLGELRKGEPNVVVAVSAVTRSAAFGAASEAVEKIVAEAPIWRLETDGETRGWVRGTAHTPHFGEKKA